MVELGLNLELSQIRAMKKDKFADIVKKACRAAAFRELSDNKESLSKMSNLKYKELSMQDYLKSDVISADKAKSLYKYRVRNIKVKNNMKSAHADLNCPLPLCSSKPVKSLDDQHHLLHCSDLVDYDLATPDGRCCTYQDIFSDSVAKMAAVIDLLDKSMERREKIIQNEKGQ